VGFKRAKPFDALLRVRKPYRQAHFCELENFLQEKKFSKTNCKQRVSSKIIQWMIFDGRNCFQFTPAQYVQMRTDVRQHRNGIQSLSIFILL